MSTTIKKIKVRAYNMREAMDIITKLRSYAYEGVQNDSLRYCDIMAHYALEQGICFICIPAGAYGASMRISNSHDKVARGFVEVSKSRFLALASQIIYKEDKQ